MIAEDAAALDRSRRFATGPAALTTMHAMLMWNRAVQPCSGTKNAQADAHPQILKSCMPCIDGRWDGRLQSTHTHIRHQTRSLRSNAVWGHIRYAWLQMSSHSREMDALTRHSGFCNTENDALKLKRIVQKLHGIDISE